MIWNDLFDFSPLGDFLLRSFGGASLKIKLKLFIKFHICL